jgi:hypothetical protein
MNKSNNDFENAKNVQRIKTQNERNIEMIRKDLCKLELHFFLKQ